LLICSFALLLLSASTAYTPRGVALESDDVQRLVLHMPLLHARMLRSVRPYVDMRPSLLLLSPCGCSLFCGAAAASVLLLLLLVFVLQLPTAVCVCCGDGP
jgi:hypothetical protein